MGAVGGAAVVVVVRGLGRVVGGRGAVVATTVVAGVVGTVVAVVPTVGALGTVVVFGGT